ncbi:MAG: hypothetical protein H7839_21495 [Magnetococcus sp. YQC-5]
MKRSSASSKMGHAATMLNLLIIALMAHELADLTWKWILGENLREPAQMIRRDALSPEVRPASQSHDVRFQGLFGQAASTAGVEPVNLLPPPPKDIPITQLKMSLLGILFADQGPAKARAIISTPDIPERPYAIGDTLGPVVIQSIHLDQVILNYNGQHETLRLPKLEPVQEQAALLTNNKLAPENRALMGKLWNNFQEKPESILENVRIEPSFVNGQFTGVQLFPGKDPEFLQKFGVQPGDRVTWINGIELTDPLKGMTVLGTLGNAKAVQFRIVRGQETLSFEFQRP